MADKKVKVTPTGQPVCEEGVHYSKGEPIEVTASRAKALGKLVEPYKAPAKEESSDSKD